MAVMLDAYEVETLRWVLGCYLADRTMPEDRAGSGDDIGAMFEAAERDRRTVIELLARLEFESRLRVRESAVRASVPATAMLAAPVVRAV